MRLSKSQAKRRWGSNVPAALRPADQNTVRLCVSIARSAEEQVAELERMFALADPRKDA